MDIARVIAPDLPTKIIGIRPGEKLHEVMITTDDARNTLSLPDRYIIIPTLAFWEPERHTFAGSKPVVDDFYYASDNNPEQLSLDEIKTLLSQIRS